MRAIWADLQSAPIDERLRAALQLAGTLTRTPHEFGAPDLDAARSASLSDAAIEDAIEICCAFNIITRIADTLAFEEPSWEEHLKGAKILLKRGYR